MQRLVRSLLGRDRSLASVAPELPPAVAVVPEGLRMAEDWDRRAREDARWHIASDVANDQEFATTGRRDVDVALGPLDDAWLRDARALEIGCGTGRMTEFLLRRVRTLDAIDVSSEMIERAKARLGDRPNLRLLATSGQDLAPFADGSFELVLSYVVLQHIPNDICRVYFRESAASCTPTVSSGDRSRGSPLPASSSRSITIRSACVAGHWRNCGPSSSAGAAPSSR